MSPDQPVDEAASQTRPLTTPKGPSFYNEICFAPSVDDPRQLIFVATPGSPKPPEGLVPLRQDYERTARVVSVLFNDEKKTRKELFLQLHQAADRGLRGPEFNIEDGRENLKSVHDTITDYAHHVRDKRLAEYTQLLKYWGLAPLVLGAVVFLFAQPAADQPYKLVIIWILSALWIPAGAAICVWGDFALRMQAGLSYDQLLNMDPSRWRPAQRLLVTVVIAFIFAFLLAFDTVQIGVGSLLLNDFSKKPAIAIAVGGITGLAFAAVRDIIFRVKPDERK